MELQHCNTATLQQRVHQIMFVCKDVDTALGYTNTQKAIRDHVDDDDKQTEQFVLSGQARSIIMINESGLYSLIPSSKLPQAKAFKRWVTNEVLPQIFKVKIYLYDFFFVYLQPNKVVPQSLWHLNNQAVLTKLSINLKIKLMNTKRLMIALALIFAVSTGVSAQGWLNKLKDKAKEKIQNKVDENVDKGMDRVLNKAEDEATGAVKGKKDKTSKAEKAAEEDVSVAEADPTVATTTDFKRGSVILFQDDVTAETVGEFPSKWDIFQGTVETKTIGGVKAINLTDDARVQPFIKEKGAYLPEEFTIEYDFYYWPNNRVPGNDGIGLNDLKMILAATKDRSDFPGEGFDEGELTAFVLRHSVCAEKEQSYLFNGNKEGSFNYAFKKGWNHVALSFNKRALKVYFNEKRVVNLPRVNQPTWLCFQVPFEYKNMTFIRNVVIAKGAVELYNRNASEIDRAIQETGKFVTNNILFKTGKADLLPESMTEIQKVADYMKKNPTARFEVQGHTDNQGSDAINDPLSQKRAESVVKALASLGVDDFNLKAVGKGSHEPVADNKTEAGRAKNRRVEFIKR